tara:strand:- start:680 stop:850 length:171 start_codon:yes stop_codon:yes gene_type:complete
LAKINIKGAQISYKVKCYGTDQEAQERRLSALADMNVMTCIGLALPTSNEFNEVNQ